MKNKFLLSVALAAASFGLSAPAHAALPLVVAACDAPSLTNPDALDCAGYYDGNLLSGSNASVQQEAIRTLDGMGSYVVNWSVLDPAFKIESPNGLIGNLLSFGQTLYGKTVIGAHFGNVAGPAGNVSVFWLLDFGAGGASGLLLDDASGWSNAVLYKTGVPGVPEPTTWAMMLIGFGAIGAFMRRRRPESSKGRVSFA